MLGLPDRDYPTRTQEKNMPRIKMKSFALTCAVLLIGCAQEEAVEGEGTIMEDTTAMAPEPVGISLTDVAGTWNVQAVTEAGDSVPAYELVATDDMSDWTMNFPDRPPISVRVVAVVGDSIVTESGPYESVLRPGVQVSTQTVFRVQDGTLMGSTVARYQTSEPDSVVRVSSVGTRGL